VRGHSNVQGDRTMGIWERPTNEFLDRLGAEFAFAPPRAHGHDTVSALHALDDGRARVFIALGGNFARATPDSALGARALGRAALTVQISTTLNRSHLVHGREALILPTLGRTERDVRGDTPQFVTVEDSMRCVHRSMGRLAPASAELRSEPAIVCGIARAALGPGHAFPWEEFASDYDRVRERIARVVPGFEDYNRRVREGPFRLPNSARDRREWKTANGRANFVVAPIPRYWIDRGRNRACLPEIRVYRGRSGPSQDTREARAFRLQELVTTAPRQDLNKWTGPRTRTHSPGKPANRKEGRQPFGFERETRRYAGQRYGRVQVRRHHRRNRQGEEEGPQDAEPGHLADRCDARRPLQPVDGRVDARMDHGSHLG
jgi:hypothetical protein